MSTVLTLHVLGSLWGALALSSALFAFGLMVLGDRRPGQGGLVIASAGLAGLAASHWLSMLPGLEARWAGLGFIGALLLPAAVLMRIEHEAHSTRGRAAQVAILTGLLLPSLLLPAQITRSRVCLTPELCGAADPFIALLHLGTGGLVLLMALPSLSVLCRGGTAVVRRSPGCWWLAIVLVHLGGILARLAPASPALEREVMLAALLLMLAIGAGVVTIFRWRAEAYAGHATTAAVATPVPADDLIAAQPAPASTDELAWAAPAQAQADTPLPPPGMPDFVESLPPLPPVDAPMVSDPALLARIHEQALQLLRDQSLYRQPQLRRRDVADRLKVPDYLLSRALNASSGQSFTEIVNGLRLDEACRRLGQGREPVTTIGYDVGFNSLASFNRAFREARGCSPSEYRLAQQQGQALAAGAVAA